MEETMKPYHVTGDALSVFKEGISREWVMTNGIGGYAGSSVIGAHTRKHHGYLIASLHPPVERYVILSKITERFASDGAVFDFETSQRGENYKEGGFRSECVEGQKYLKDFAYDGLVHFSYQAGDCSVEKTLCFEHGKNTIAVSYEITNNGADAVFYFTPLFNYRAHHDGSSVSDLKFETRYTRHHMYLTPEKNKEIKIRLIATDGEVVEREQRFDENMQLQTEINVEADCIDNNFTPYEVKYTVPAGKKRKIALICTIEASYNRNVEETIENEYRRLNGIIKTAGYRDQFANTLVLAADQFLAYRQSTGLTTVLAGLPWFTDWGRDTMIALTGLTLATKRFDEARDILTTFAMYVKDGLVPNMFPDEGTEPLYNTVDASLWDFYAVHKFLTYSDTPKNYAYVKEHIYPKLKEIIEAYKNGTGFSIFMDEDGLISAGSGLDQVTWMDVRVGDWVATPRHGKPVEINALWYNALKVMESLSVYYDEDPKPYHLLAEQVRESFNREFWNEEKECLYDVLEPDKKDDKVRPNQIYAVSLPYTMMSKEREKRVVEKVKDELYAGCGLRSLAPEDPDYHGVYSGCLAKRDAAYHQGTAWGFLLGGFFTAYIKVYGHSAQTMERVKEMLLPVQKHLTKGCVGTIAEIFDGNAPHTSRGCYGQAWSVGEILRAYTEDILPFL